MPRTKNTAIQKTAKSSKPKKIIRTPPVKLVSRMSTVKKVSTNTFLDIDEALDYPSSRIFIQNLSGDMDSPYPTRTTFHIEVMVDTKPINLKIVPSTIPLEITKVSKIDLLNSQHFRQIWTKGGIAIYNPSLVDKLYQQEDVKEELLRINDPDKLNQVTSDTAESDAASAQVLYILGQPDSDRKKLADLKTLKNISQKDLKYIIKNVSSASITNWCRTKMT